MIINCARLQIRNRRERNQIILCTTVTSGNGVADNSDTTAIGTRADNDADPIAIGAYLLMTQIVRDN